MTTIEERAVERYKNPQEPYCFESEGEQQWYNCGARDGYIDGATEQDSIARQEERERCIKVFREWYCKTTCNHICDAKQMCETAAEIRQAIAEGCAE